MASEPVRDPRSDELLTPQNCTLVMPSVPSLVSATPGCTPYRTGSPEAGVAGWVQATASRSPLL